MELSLQPGAVNYVTPLDAAAAEITRPSEEARDFHHAAGVANIALLTPSAPASPNWRRQFGTSPYLLDDVEEESTAVSAIAQHCYGSLIATGVAHPRPARRDRRTGDGAAGCAAGFADIGNSDRVGEIEDVLAPGWRNGGRWI